MNDLKERIVEFVQAQAGIGGLHDVTIARGLDEDLNSIAAALTELREEGRITGRDTKTRTGNGVMSMDNIQLVERNLSDESDEDGAPSP